MTDIVERLRIYATDDHERGCQGRCYDCSCGYDEKRDPLLKEAAAEIEQNRIDLNEYQLDVERLRGLNAQYLTALWDVHALANGWRNVPITGAHFDRIRHTARAALANDVRITAQPAAPGGDK
jgi:hypothetical protein